MMLKSWRGRLVLALIVMASLGLGIHSCSFDWRCLSRTYPAHCDGTVAVQCEGGRGSLPLVRRDDCRKASKGPGICVESATDSSARLVPECVTYCDPSTYVPHCDGLVALNCRRYKATDPFEVWEYGCNEQFGCEMRVARDGKREAICRGDPDYSKAGSEESQDVNIP
jgi:hypothetical protein